MLLACTVAMLFECTVTAHKLIAQSHFIENCQHFHQIWKTLPIIAKLQ